MNRDGAITTLQSVTVVLACAAVGASLAKVDGTDDLGLMALGGAVVGVIAVAIGLVVRKPVKDFERRRGPKRLIGLRIMTAGFIAAVIGWLVAIFVSGALGYLLVVIGTVSGIIGIVIHNLNLLKPVK